MTMSVVMYKRLGISNTDIALYTSWLYLPWVIKPLWSPFVDITRTKRFWVVTMQFLVTLGLALAAFSIPGSAFFKWSLFLFWIMAFASATHDIAADGFYMLSMSKHEQAWWVGLRSTFYRTAMIVGGGLLVVLAGVLESRNGLAPVEISVSASTKAPVAAHVNPAEINFTDALSSATEERAGAKRPNDSGSNLVAATQNPSPLPSLRSGGVREMTPGQLRVLAQPGSLEIALVERSAPEAKAAIEQAKSWNLQHGFVSIDKLAVKLEENRRESFWTKLISGPLKKFLSRHFPKPEMARPAATAGNFGVIYFALSQPPPPGKTISVNFTRKPSGIEYIGFGKSDKGFRLMEGERFSFGDTNWNQPAMAIIQLDPKLKQDTAVVFQTSSGNIPLAWSITLFVVAALFLGFSCWHSVMLPRPAGDGPVVTHKSLAGEFFATLGSFFQKPGVVLALAFILFYRFDEAQLVKVISPFLLDSRAAGGLGLATSQVGLAYGTFGILALTCGGLLGGFSAAKYGLKKMLPIMLCTMYLPKFAWVFLSFVQPENFLVTCCAVAAEQFGYGFGFTAFMLYMLYFADGPHKTAHYAICTGFMALGMMLPGMWSGWVADIVGYKHFFVWVICSTIPGLLIALSLKIDPQFGRKLEPAPKN
jgi:PAT family beta-lactamase induction signal transducer AmpG